MALRTTGQHVVLLAAVMAFQHVVFAVDGKTYVAIEALGDIAALRTHQKTAVSTPIQEKHCLVAVGNSLGKAFLQQIAEYPFVAVPRFQRHVHHMHCGQRTFVYAFGH